MIKLVFEKNDSLLSFRKKIRQISDQSDVIILDFTKHAPSVDVNFFRILEKEFPKKKFSILSSDNALCRIAENAWLKTSFKDERMSFNTQYAKTHILRHNFTFLEYLIYELKRFFSYISYVIFNKRNPRTYALATNYQNSNVILIMAGLIVSVSLLLFIFYFTVSKTYVYITPEVSVKSIPANILLTQNVALQTDWKNIVRTRVMTVPVNHHATFRVQQIDPNSTQNAKWKITLYNELSNEQVFRPDTRFVTDDGIVYRAGVWITLPGKRVQNGVTVLWTVDAIISADPFDVSGNMVWDRGNIVEWTTLTMPGLKFNREYIYAKTREDFVWWESPKVHIVTQDELVKFENIMKEQMKKIAYDTLASELKKRNTESWEDYIIFGGDTITFTWEEIHTTEVIRVWEKREEISYDAKALVQGLVYDRKQTLSYLSQVLHDRMLYGTEKELWTDVNSLRISSILNRTEQAIKATAEVNVNMTYDFENSSNNLTRKLKAMIANTTEKEAVSKLVNDPNIAKVRINFSPFWLTRVSSNPDNIEFIIDKK